jgi:hypothetical protein
MILLSPHLFSHWSIPLKSFKSERILNSVGTSPLEIHIYFVTSDI